MNGMRFGAGTLVMPVEFKGGPARRVVAEMGRARPRGELFKRGVVSAEEQLAFDSRWKRDGVEGAEVA